MIRFIYIIVIKSFIFMSLTNWSASAGENGIIAFTKYLDKNWEIVTTDENGGNMVNHSKNPAEDSHPAWSPDGKHIAFASDRDGNYEIYIMDADSSNQRRITMNPRFDAMPSFAPDGRNLAFTRMRVDALGGLDYENAQIFIVGVNGERERFLTVGVGMQWSPDGRKIAFSKKEPGKKWGIYLADPDGRNQLDITGSLNDMYPSWSPDGKQLVFASARSTLKGTNIYKIGSDGGNEVRLTRGDEVHTGPVWSPDGQYIAFSILPGAIDRDYRIMVMKADGTDLKEISKGDRPSWFDPAFARYAVNSAGKMVNIWGEIKKKGL